MSKSSCQRLTHACLAAAVLSGLFSVDVLSWTETLRLLILGTGLGALIYRHRDQVLQNEGMPAGASVILAVTVAFCVTQFDPATASLHYRAAQERLNIVFVVTTLAGLSAGFATILAYRETFSWTCLTVMDRIVLVIVVGAGLLAPLSRFAIGQGIGRDEILAFAKVISYGTWWVAITRVYGDRVWRVPVPRVCGRWVAPMVVVSALWIPSLGYGGYRTLRVVDLLGEGQQAYLREDWPTAQSHYEKVAELNRVVDYGPARDTYLEDLALLQFRLGHEKEAAALIHRLRSSTIDVIDGERKAADIYLVAERWWDAVGAYERVLAKRPSRRDQDRLGLAYLRVRDVRSFTDLVDRYAYLPGVDAQTFEELVFLGNVQFSREQFGSALTLFRQAADVRPESAYAQYKIGRALFEQGQVGPAAAQYRRAVELQPDFADAHYRLGLCLQSEEDIPGALIAYEEAVRILPSHADGKQALTRLSDLDN